MLERATACLKSGAAQESLKSIQRVSRSRRMLHSTFWNHGAGDLDLPPWVVSAFPMPSDLPLKHNDTALWRQSSEKSMQTEFLKGSSTSFEGVFLDFLYPPQALAWLRRAKAQHWKRWEKRNARRLPEGFVVASRGYASSPQVQDSLKKAVSTVNDVNDMNNSLATGEPDGGEDEPLVEQLIHRTFYETAAQEQRDGTKDSSSSLQDKDTRSDSAVAYNPYWQEKSRLEEDHTEQSANVVLNANLPAGTSTTTEFADSPSDLAEGVCSHLSTGDLTLKSADTTDPLQNLRQLMMLSRSGRAKNSPEISNKAMSIYDTLDESTKGDVRLRRELTEWLSVQQNELARSRCVELYHSIPSSERNLQTYQAAISVLSDAREVNQVPEIHKEALQNLENGHQISRMLFTRAVEHQRWGVAVQAERAHSERYQDRHIGANPASQIRIFWHHVSEIPQLLQKAIQLWKYLEEGENQGLVDEHTRQFAATFYKEALTQEFLRPGSVRSFKYISRDGTPRFQIRQLLNHIASVQGDSRDFFHDLLMQILTSSQLRYPQLHEIASFLYGKYRDMSGPPPSEKLLMLWLERLTEYYGKLRKLDTTLNSVSLADLIKEWKKHHGHVSKDAVKRLMTFYAKFGQLRSYEHWLEYLRSVFPDYRDQKDILWTTIWIHARRADLDRAQQAFAEVKRTTAEHGEEPDIVCWNLLLHAHARADDLEGAVINLQNLIKFGGVKPDARSFHNVLQLLAKRGDVANVEDLLKRYDRVVEEKRGTALLGSLLLAHCNNNDVQKAETILQEAIPLVRKDEIIGSLVGCFNIILTAHAMHRDIDSAMRTYRWMKDEGIARDANSYAAVMQALVFYRRTQEANWIMKRIMPENNVKPTAFHYGILISGYVNNRQPKMAIEVYDTMVQMNIRPSISANAAYLKAKAVTEGREPKQQDLTSSPSVTLEEIVEEMKYFLRTSDSADIADKQPGLGFADRMTFSEASPAAYFDYLISVHGQRRSFDAVKALYQQYKENVEEHGKDSHISPIGLLTSFAASSWHHGEHEYIEYCWKSAKEQADRKSLLVEGPILNSPDEKNRPANESIRLELSASESSTLGQNAAPKAAESRSSENIVTQKQSVSLDEQTSRLRAPARRHILTNILRFYLLSLQSQGKTADAISTVTQIMNQGYTMDNMTWNTFIESLCQTTPPLALLAYALTERFLTPHFPGWSPIVEYPPRPEAVAKGLEYIKARYLAPGQLMPKYRTVVYLAGALLQLRKMLAFTGGSSSYAVKPELKKYVGTIDQIRRHAPKTFLMVQSMPNVPDELQSQVLRGEGS